MNELSQVFAGALFLAHSLVPDWGLAIVVLSLALRLVFFPLQLAVARESRKLRRIEPELRALLERHRAAPAAYLRASGELKRRNGVRSWLLPILTLLQLPIFIVVTRGISRMTELHGAPFLWIRNLAGADPTFLLPLFVCAAIWLQMRGRQSRAETKVAVPGWLSPALSFVFMVTMPAALALHTLVGTLVQIGGDRVIDRMSGGV